MELLDLKIFCDLIELKSFTEAARNNFLTQSAVSQRINKLNDYYGNKLFLDKKRLLLSPQGKYLYGKFKDILKIYRSTEEIIDQKNTRDILSIGFSENAKAKYYDLNLLKAILDKDILPEIYFGSSQTVYEKVLFGTLNYGVVGSVPNRSSDLIFNQLFEEEIVLATGFANVPETPLIEKLPIILDHRDSGLYRFLRNELQGHGIEIEKLDIRGFVGTSSEKLEIIANTDFYCFLPEWYLSEHSQAKVVSLPFTFRRNFYEIYNKKNAKRVSFLSQLIRNNNSFIS